MSKTYKNYPLEKYQQLVRQLATSRGFDGETVSQKFVLLLEESGEFAKAARKLSGISSDESSQRFTLEEEAADIFYVLLDLCNTLDIDLAKAFEAKEAKNQKRTWS
jgi:NTP pyrophosphatase (non-canonical NTP hydrolase)